MRMGTPNIYMLPNQHFKIQKGISHALVSISDTLTEDFFL
jgi:hypothetical protein